MEHDTPFSTASLTFLLVKLLHKHIYITSPWANNNDNDYVSADGKSCAWDGGDCCGKVVKTYCKDCKCKDPVFKSSKSGCRGGIERVINKKLSANKYRYKFENDDYSGEEKECSKFDH